MKKFAVLILIIMLMVFSLTGCNNIPVYEDTVKITGDIVLPFDLDSLKDFETKDIKIDGKNYSSITLSDIIKKVQPYDIEGDILITGKDGTAAKINSADADGVSILYQKEYKWRVYAEGYPAVTAIKDIESILFISKNITEDTGAIITDGVDFILSAGNLIFKNYSALGSEVSLNGHLAAKYKRDKIENKIAIADYAAEVLDFDNMQIYLDNRDIIRNIKNADGYLSVRGNRVDFTNGWIIYEGVKGIALGCGKVLTDLFEDFKASIDGGGKTMIIELDGFSLSQFKKFRFDLDCLGSITPIKTLSVMPAISNVALAAILSGKTPYENGITLRKERNLKVNTIFDYAKSLNKSYSYIEGNSTLINLEGIETELNIDLNGNGLIDDEIFNSAMGKRDKDLIYIHFHSIDDFNHKNNPYSSETLNQIKLIDGYIKKLTEGYGGNVFIVSDHGSYPVTAAEGSHGNFRGQGMFVPYFTIRGQNNG